MELVKVVAELFLVNQGGATFYERDQELVPVVAVVVAWWLVELE